jgi:hypothetical protein
MIINRRWAMPCKNTFQIKWFRYIIHKYHKVGELSIDPFANRNRIAKITNDIDTDFDTDFNIDALDFLQTFESQSVDFVFYDPPYSPRQVSESYKKMGLSVNMETTQASFWGNIKKEISRVVKPCGIVASFGWNSNGIGMENRFDIAEILIVAHGGQHNDTICVIEKKDKQQLLI